MSKRTVPASRVGHHQRGRGQESLLGIGVDAPVKVAVAREHGGGVQVAVDDFLLDLWDPARRSCRCRWCRRRPRCQSPAFPARAAGRCLPGTAWPLWSRGRTRFSPRACAPGPGRWPLRATKAAAITLRGLLVLVQLVMAAMMTAPSGIRPWASSPCPLQLGGIGNAALGQIAGGQAAVRVAGAGHVAHHGGQVKAAARARTAAVSRVSAHRPVCFGIGFHQATWAGSRPVRRR